MTLKLAPQKYALQKHSSHYFRNSYMYIHLGLGKPDCMPQAIMKKNEMDKKGN